MMNWAVPNEEGRILQFGLLLPPMTRIEGEWFCACSTCGEPTRGDRFIDIDSVPDDLMDELLELPDEQLTAALEAMPLHPMVVQGIVNAS